MKCLVVEKWIEPYVILEKFKKYFECVDLTFDGFSKTIEKKNMLTLIQNSSDLTVGIYMKNVNKFYVMTSENLSSLSKVFEELGLDKGEISLKDDAEEGILLIDMAKAEFIVITRD